MGEAEKLRELADRVEGLCGPVERELSNQLQTGDFAGTLANETEDAVTGTKSGLNSLAETLRGIADERE